MSEALGGRHSVLDVVENALGERGDRVSWEKLAKGQIDDLRDRLLEFSIADADSGAPEGTYLVGGTVSRYWEDPLMRRELSDALLYYPQLLVLDPYADFFADLSVLPAMRDIRYTKNGREIMRLSTGASIWATGDSAQRLADAPDELRSRLATITRNLYELERPIRAGVIVLRNQWEVMRKNRRSLEAAVRHDVRSTAMQATMSALQDQDARLPLWDHLRGFHITGSGTIHHADAVWQYQHFFFHLAKTLAVADSAGATYAPTWNEDLALLKAKVADSPTGGYPPQVLKEVSRFLVPSPETSIREAARIRESSADFEDWRVKLRTLARDARADNAAELRERVEDAFRPDIRRIERELSGRHTRAGKEAFTDFVILGSVGGLGAAVTANGDPTPIAVAGAAAAATGVIDWIRKAYRKPHLAGADAVLGALVPDRPR
ncbi:hypothetical protein [Microbacterium enclense]|uniref:Uncharacterized protein n=1 Tax=Microbacterium enclense TaxID=993073 RepID=A0A1G6ID31_9MICO|nr:hypothetical protein [Microbacterium enclense]KSU54998.1 hypothetical protein AS029_05990 [Microbacterium enclense]SDC03656.1 hypothetical protein SAMN05216418_1454 [Microbacterium enclense]